MGVNWLFVLTVNTTAKRKSGKRKKVCAHLCKCVRECGSVCLLSSSCSQGNWRLAWRGLSWTAQPAGTWRDAVRDLGEDFILKKCVRNKNITRQMRRIKSGTKHCLFYFLVLKLPLPYAATPVTRCSEAMWVGEFNEWVMSRVHCLFNPGGWEQWHSRTTMAVNTIPTPFLDGEWLWSGTTKLKMQLCI